MPCEHLLSSSSRPRYVHRERWPAPAPLFRLYGERTCTSFQPIVVILLPRVSVFSRVTQRWAAVQLVEWGGALGSCSWDPMGWSSLLHLALPHSRRGVTARRGGSARFPD